MDPAFSEMLCKLKRGSAAGAAAERSHHDREPYALKVFVYYLYGIFRRESGGDDVASGSAPGEPAAAEKGERISVLSGNGVGVDKQISQAFAERAAHAAGDGGAGSAYSDK
jgi:hypothetical protein